MYENEICIIEYAVFFQVNCVWETWSAWSPCSISCGKGTKTRIRRILSHEENGGSCKGHSIETSHVDCGNCPTGIIKSFSYLKHGSHLSRFTIDL